MYQKGKNTVLIVQPKDATIGSDALAIAGLTENSYSIENELIDEMTKMGRILEYGDNSESFELTAYGKKGDPGQMAVLDAIKNKKKLKVWEVDLDANEEGTYDAVFAQCLVESVETDNAQDSFREVSATLQVEGSSVEGVLDEIPAELAQGNTYDFEKPGETGSPTP